MTFAKFKRDAASGKMNLSLTQRFGQTGDAIPERLRGSRKVVRVRSYGIDLKNATNEATSRLDIPSAKLIDYDGKTFRVYAVGERALTEEEAKLLKEWEEIQSKHELETPWIDSYWKKVRFFEESTCPWMMGTSVVRGKRYLSHNHTVLDRSVRGDVILDYNVIMD